MKMEMRAEAQVLGQRRDPQEWLHLAPDSARHSKRHPRTYKISDSPPVVSSVGVHLLPAAMDASLIELVKGDQIRT